MGKTRSTSVRTTLALFGCCAGTLVVYAQSPDRSGGLQLRPRAQVHVQTVVTPQTIMRVLTSPAHDQWQPRAAVERARGLEDVYASWAPSVVVVRTSTGHGTGFVVGDGGLIATNAHVVRDGLDVDVGRGASFAHVHTGASQPNGLMRLAEQSLRAYVLKVDPEKDLALLRVDAPSDTLRTLKVIALASSEPRPGMACTIIGHPASGMLWTIRSGEVAAVGTAPTDLIDLVIARLAATPSEKASIEGALRVAPTFRMFLSTAGANPGDSGSPVLNAAGEAVGVTFAIPSDVGERRFTYHIHVAELRAFLASVPDSPIAVVPDPWDLGPRLGLVDLNDDSRPDALVELTETGPKLLLDVDGDSKLPDGKMTDEQFQTLVTHREWNFEAALDLSGREVKAFYDRDNDGEIDLVMIGNVQNNSVTQRFERSSGAWRAVQPDGALVSEAYFQSPVLAAKFGGLMTAVRSALTRRSDSPQ